MGEQVFLDFYIKLSLIIVLIDLVLAVKSCRKGTKTGRYLGYACIGAAVVNVSYLASIVHEEYRFVSIMSSIYFVSIDYMLIALLAFTRHFTRRSVNSLGQRLMKSFMGYTLFETAVFAVNPFYEIAIRYVWRDTFIAKYNYDMLPLYWMHLIFTYSLIGLVIVMLVHKMYIIPREYRNQYLFVIVGILGIVGINAIFLFLPGVNVYNLLDYSILGYSLIAFLLYWSCFNYSTHGMLNRLKTSIFENIDQGIVLFDYHNNLILSNEKAKYLLGENGLDDRMTLEEFMSRHHISVYPEMENDGYSVQCNVKDGDLIRPLRCDIRPLKNDRLQLLGKLLVLSDIALETDLLTGFQNWESFRKFAKENTDTFGSSTAAVICDINSLSVINSTFGYSEGDQKIKLLADTMRQYCPRRTYYVRGHEANLIALCSHSSEAEMQRCMELVKIHFSDKLQYAISITTAETPDILDTIDLASKGMRAKKLLDRESIHSDMLTSLIRALQECDSDTESHVRRTQLLGAELGKRIGLTDIQQSDLSLLCLLHDIGKIGIPLEILNKPGKLTDDEWKIMKSHVEKGYEIANSNKELRRIADIILHHHERWDGKGYPNGQSGEEIPLLSRVIAVVDAYDAMVSDRCYRPAMSKSAAAAELNRCAGTQFDPYIVAEFLRMTGKGRKKQ